MFSSLLLLSFTRKIEDVQGGLSYFMVPVGHVPQGRSAQKLLACLFQNVFHVQGEPTIHLKVLVQESNAGHARSIHIQANREQHPAQIVLSGLRPTLVRQSVCSVDQGRDQHHLTIHGRAHLFNVSLVLLAHIAQDEPMSNA